MKNKDNIKVQTPIEQEQNDENIPKNREDADVQEFEWGKHPNSLKALKKNQYPKGTSGNVLGRPFKFENLAKELKKLGDEETFDYNKESQGTRKEQVLKRIWYDAVRGNDKKIQLLAWLGCLD